MQRKNIILCGFMGCGKTAVAKELAPRIFYDAVDLDERIEAVAGMDIPTIFEQLGEEAFRDLESKVFADLCQNSAQVIATGGGAFMRENNRKIATEGGVVVFINTSFDLCYERIQDSSRPIVRRSTPEQLHALFEQRTPIYRSICTYEVFNNNQPKDAAKAIIYTTQRVDVRLATPTGNPQKP